MIICLNKDGKKSNKESNWLQETKALKTVEDEN